MRGIEGQERLPDETSRRLWGGGRPPVAGVLIVLVALAYAGSLPAGRAAAGASSEGARGGALCQLLEPLLGLDCEQRSDQTPSAQPGEQAVAGPQATADGQAAGTGLVRVTAGEPRYDPKRLAITFKPGTEPGVIKALLRKAGVGLEQAIPQIRSYMVAVDPARRAAALARLRASPAVASAGREILVAALDTVPSNPYWPQQWGLRLAGFPKAWDLNASGGGSPIVVAVVDTGVDPAQPGLRGALVPGYDFVNSTSSVGDDQGHGTAVAAIIAARGNTQEGIAGVCWSCLIMPIKVLDESGSGDDSVIAAGIVWAADHQARVINLSLGGPGVTTDLSDAIAYALDKGALVIAAAGNNGSSVPFYPAADPHAISVAATTATDQPYPWSDFGAWVNLAAPGCNLAPILQGGYGSFCGTSSATPLVSGLAALALSANPGASPAEIRQALEQPALPLSGFVQHGRIDAPATLALIQPAGAAPTNETGSRATLVFRGRVGAGPKTRSFSLTVGGGLVTATLSYPGRSTLGLQLIPQTASEASSRVRGRSPLRLRRTLAAETITVVVGGHARVRFVLTMSYARAE
jgi:subtilisin family serine protease